MSALRSGCSSTALHRNCPNCSQSAKFCSGPFNLFNSFNFGCGLFATCHFPMTPDVPNNPRAELEARLTALLLGELPADEAAALRERIAHDAELAKLYAQLEHTIELFRATAA